MKTLIASVLIGGLFGSASATVESIDSDAMVVEIEVEVVGALSTVVAHLSWEDSELVLPLLDRGGGVFGITTELPPRNYFVVFEVIGEQGERSEAVSLTEMGAELERGLGGATTSAPDDDGLGEESRQMLWLAVALGAASLSALAFWVLGGRADDASDDREEEVSGEEALERDEPKSDEEE